MRDVEVDARGLHCPLPVIRLAETVREHTVAAGGAQATDEPLRVTVLATDPAARHDIPAWCRMRGHAPPQTQDRGDHTAYLVVVAVQPEKARGS